MKVKSCFIVILLVVFSLAVCAQAAFAEDKYPSKPIRIIITHKAGGSTDRPARLVAPYMEKNLGVNLVIENMVGAGGSIARKYVYSQKPDGYTLLFSQHPSLTISSITTGAYDPLSYVPIYGISGGNYQGIGVPYDSPYKDLRDLIKASQKERITICGAGIGAQSFLATILLNKKGGANFTYIPFNSTPQALLGVASGSVDSICSTYSQFGPMEKKKKIRLITTLGPKRAEFAPNIPTGLELGVPVQLDQMGGFFGPPGLSDDKRAILAAAIDKAVKDPEFLANAKKVNEGLGLLGPEEFEKAVTDLHNVTMEAAPYIKEAIKKKK